MISTGIDHSPFWPKRRSNYKKVDKEIYPFLVIVLQIISHYRPSCQIRAPSYFHHLWNQSDYWLKIASLWYWLHQRHICHLHMNICTYIRYIKFFHKKNMNAPSTRTKVFINHCLDCHNTEEFRHTSFIHNKYERKLGDSYPQY